jgi:dipeptidyl aminopeptidase/acylaminoacyl peptidase
MSRGEIVKIVAEHPTYDLRTGPEGFASLHFRKGTSELIGITYDAEKPRTVWLDPGFAAVQKAMDSNLPEHVNMPVDWSRSGNTFVYFSFSDRDPGTYYVLRPLERRLIPVQVLGESLKQKKLGKTEPWKFQARDGATIHAYVTRPPEPTEERPPLVVDIHGGPMARDSWGFSERNQFLATRGYVVLQVNYRGSSGFGAAYQKVGLYSRLDTVVLDDIADGVRQLIASGEVDPNRVAVMGGSFGGWATYMSLIKYPELYRAGVAISAVAHWRKTLRDDRDRFGNQSAYRFWKALLDREDFDEVEPFIDPYRRAKELKQPILLMHGELDRIVHATEARLMLDELKKHNPHVESRSFTQATHSYWPFATRVTRLNEIETFLRRHLAPAENVASN